MRAHKFKIGQTVLYTPGRTTAATSHGKYKIVRLLPADDVDLQYRIQNQMEAFERVARESDLSRA